MVLYITGPSKLGDFQNEATLWNANYLKYIITMAIITITLAPIIHMQRLLNNEDDNMMSSLQPTG